VEELWYQVRKKVGDIRGDLPPGIIGPNFNDEYGDVYSALYMLTADGLSLAELKTRAEDIRQRLLRVPDVNKVDIIGERPQKIFIEFSHARLATLGVTPQQIFDSVAKQNAVVSGGSVDTSADRINVRVTGAFSGAEAIAAVPVQADGRVFRLGDIATVKRGYEDPPTFIVREGGRPAIGLGVSMADGANIITLGENLKEAMKSVTAELPVGIGSPRSPISRISSMSRYRNSSRASARRSLSCWSLVSCRSAGAPALSSRYRCRLSWPSCFSSCTAPGSTCTGSRSARSSSLSGCSSMTRSSLSR
jgi:multidrug efflux pump subunit AcrB